MVCGGLRAEQSIGRESTASARRNLYPTLTVVFPGLITCKKVFAKSYIRDLRRNTALERFHRIFQ